LPNQQTKPNQPMQPSKVFSLSIQPGNGCPGTSVRAHGIGFTPGSGVIEWDWGPGRSRQVLANFRVTDQGQMVDLSGNREVSFQAPSDASAGTV
jgi:hypothetical protein